MVKTTLRISAIQRLIPARRVTEYQDIRWFSHRIFVEMPSRPIDRMARLTKNVHKVGWMRCQRANNAKENAYDV